MRRNLSSQEAQTDDRSGKYVRPTFREFMIEAGVQKKKMKEITTFFSNGLSWHIVPLGLVKGGNNSMSEN